MLEVIKMFGVGILYTILFPFIVAIFAGYLVYVFGNYLVMESINIFGFFFGYTFSEETELERKLREMKEGPELEENEETEERETVSVKEETKVVYQYEGDTTEFSMEDEKGSDEQWVPLTF